MIFPFSPDACPDRQHMSFSSNRNPAAGRKFNGPYRYAVLRENRQRKQYLSAGIDPKPVILRGTLIGLTKNFTEIADSIEPAHLCDFFHREIGVQQQLRRNFQTEFTNVSGRGTPECLPEMPAQ